ncbi:MAG: hypothetical protein EPO20_10165 [Betaproteobacteria bacterium]|nr:MAG: hypothetical protein EPO20_10165 [Betaproteobacteria bacterium]
MPDITYIDTTLRDGQMSLWATGMRTEMMLAVASYMDEAGFVAIEILATNFDKKIVRELGEDSWERIDLVGERVKKTPLRMIRSRYLAAFQITPLSIDEIWWKRIAAHGIREARLADPSNTVARWRYLVGQARKVGIAPILNLIYTYSPKHTDEYYAEKAREAAKLDVVRICIKDPGSLLTPERTRTLVPVVLKNVNGIPLEFHTHCHTGLGPLCCLEAIKLGIRHINTAIPPLADGSSNPSILNIVKNARALGYSSSVDEDAIKAVEKHLTSVAIQEGLPLGVPAPYDHEQFIHQVPGGMISNLRHQLASAGLGNKLDEVLKETARVREDLGYPIMVTPYSQYVGVQAAINVVAGERYKTVTDEIIQYALGHWGEEESDAIDPTIKDVILRRSRADELARWQPPQPTLAEMREQYGDSNISDDELLLRYVAGKEEVITMRAERSQSRSSDGTRDLQGLINGLTRQKRPAYVYVRKGAGSVLIAGKEGN